MDLSRTANIDDLRELARRRLPRIVFDFFDGGAEDEVSLRNNRTAFHRVRFAPRVLRDVAKVDAATEILGGPSKYPLLIAPVGAIGMGWPGGDLAIARAAAAYGIPFTLSTAATVSIEEVADKAPGRLWFQLYVLYDREFTNRLVERARAAGYEALVVTVDLPVGGKRERDTHNGFILPFRPGWRELLAGIVHPSWALRIAAAGGIPELVNMRGLAGSQRADMASAASSVGQQHDASFDDNGLARLRDLWKGKLIVKGVSRAEDAERVARLGADAVWLSNHGGRQLDGAVAAVDALPAVAAALGGKLPILIDGGVRRGADAIKARALGAQAVAIGRPTLYGAAAAGEAGARRALEILTDEIERTLRLCGARTMDEVGSDLIVR
jgi:isopentenyl diphosphate isomerase/L-lactate dehydrogenase-like FMN-dependent dehydrogenase